MRENTIDTIDKINKIDTLKKNEKNEKNEKIKKITATNDIEINGIVYFIPDKYLGNALLYLSNEHKNAYKYIIAMYLDALIMSNKIDTISKITKKNIDDAIFFSEKIMSYIIMGKVCITNLTTTEKLILSKIPENLIQKFNPTIIEKID